MQQRNFYNNIMVLDKEKHKDLRLKVDNNYHIFSNTNALPIAGVEFIEASREHAIAFINYQNEGIIPVYILGLRDNENLLLNPDNSWKYRYVPAFVRRYPYIMVEPNEEGKSAICIDADYEGINDPKGDSIFIQEKDKIMPAPPLESAMEMLQDFNAQLTRTREFTKRLEEYDLLQEIAPQINLADGRDFSIGGIYTIDEKKLLELEDEKALTLYRSGEMAWIYNQLASLSNLLRLADCIPTKDKKVVSKK
ncbi:MAG TPA: hypothetical protein EYO74_07565, partial [Piscirickettsiaceae bacterium]|nr:hypothetical protein [Piscirickettsiaceae bacterium]